MRSDLFCSYCKPAKDIKSKEQRKCRLKLAALPFVVSFLLKYYLYVCDTPVE